MPQRPTICRAMRVAGAGETVHLGEDLVERLLALVVAAAEPAGAAGTTDRVELVELVDEDDRRRVGLGLETPRIINTNKPTS